MKRKLKSSNQRDPNNPPANENAVTWDGKTVHQSGPLTPEKVDDAVTRLSQQQEEITILKSEVQNLLQERIKIVPEVLEALRQPAVTYRRASEILVVSDRQIRRLVAIGKLEAVGGGKNKKITSSSVMQYGGLSSTPS